MRSVPYLQPVDSAGCLVYADEDPCAISDVDGDFYDYVEGSEEQDED